MIGKVLFNRGRRTEVAATLTDRGIWTCPDPELERTLNRLPQARNPCAFEDAMAYEKICCAAGLMGGRSMFFDM